METPQRAWFLFARNLSGEASQQETDELMQLLQDQPALLQQYDMMKRLWGNNSDATEPVEAAKIKKILQLSQAAAALPDEEEPVITPPALWRSLKIVRWAALIAGISFSVWALITWYNMHRHGAVAGSEIIAQHGSKTRTILPDGSTVWLNAGSKITYEPGFKGQYREITLQGEAYFDVVRNPDRPFIVHAGDINIRVLGTSFNVKSYAEDRTVETTLIKGLVQITRESNTKQDPIYLHPNQKIVLPVNDNNDQEVQQGGMQSIKHEHTAAVLNLDTTLKESEYVETAWIYNRLEFRGDSFEALARKLERWYNIRIHFEDEAARHLTFTGSVETETVEQAFLALKTAVSFNFVIKGNEVFVTSAEPVQNVSK
jgi:transmembrane sensor